jgi:hypothetical protein
LFDVANLLAMGSDVQNSIFAGTTFSRWLDDRPRKLNSVRLSPSDQGKAALFSGPYGNTRDAMVLADGERFYSKGFASRS